MTQIVINSVNNKNLFSNYYLDNLIENNLEWKKDEHKDAFQRIKKIFNAESAFLETLNEKQLEQRFFGPIFKILNHTVEVNESTKFQEFPDYALFPNRESLDDAHRNKESSSFYNNAYAIGEVKRWGIELDRFGKDKNDRKRNPSLQIWIYLHDNAPKWGVLSNGAKWRLYNKDERRDEYFEIDLPTLIATNDIDNFRYFYYFFRMEAFLPSKEGDPFLERVLHGSVEYANGIGDDLKDNVYRAMQKIGEGFFNWNQNKLDIQNEATREIVQKNTMLLLYRFLFLLYAEGKGLLDLGNPLYRDSYSFQRLKKEVKEKHDGPQQNRYQPLSTTLWSRLEDLFRLIDQGSEALGTPESDFSVPAYNGGLFDPEKHAELEEWKIGDSYLAEAIDLLSRSNVTGNLDFVDYSTLEIRHLGSIYEGLLEYKLKVSEEDMVVKGGEWCSLEAYNKGKKQQKSFSDFDEYNKVTRDHLYLATDKGERKSTGSYYTPDYIVNYIVKNTIGPVVEEKWNKAKEREQSHVDATLSVKVLDPAMGSGHFLVGAIDFLAEKLLRAAQKDIENGIISDDSNFTEDWARREVVSHCIYGVDLNYMAVELAKVGLWLTTISKDKPLSFLDHRLKQGNSLIGAQLSDLKQYPDTKKRNKDQTTLPSFISPLFITHLIGKITEIEKIRDESIDDIKKKEAVFAEFKQLSEYRKTKALANIHTSVYFGNEVTPTQNKNSDMVYHDLFWAIMGDESEWRRKTSRDWFNKANQIAMEKSFFHWELEFPEVFFEGGAPKENPGWDAVVGNPPYVRVQSLDYLEIDYFKYIYRVAHKRLDISLLFFEHAFNFVSNSGFAGYISSTQFFTAEYGRNMRKLLLENRIHSIINFVDYPLFEEALTYTGIFLFSKKPSKSFDYYCAPASLKNNELIVLSKEKNFLKFFNHNMIDILKLDEESWQLTINEIDTVFSKISNFDLSETLEEHASSNYGIITGSDKVFVINNTIADELNLEEKLIRKLLGGQDVSNYSLREPNELVIYPYEEIDGNTKLISESTLNKKYPNIYNYLKSNEFKLKARKDSRKNFGEHDGKLYGLVRFGSIRLFNNKKIVSPGECKENKFCLDDTGYCFRGARVYSISSDYYNLYFLLSLLNSGLCEAFLHSICPPKQGGYFSYAANFLNRVPIRRISFTTPIPSILGILMSISAM